MSFRLILRIVVEWKCWQCDTGWWGAALQQLNNDEIDVWQPLTAECQPFCLSVSKERWMTLQPSAGGNIQCCHDTKSLSSFLTLMPVFPQDFTSYLDWFWCLLCFLSVCKQIAFQRFLLSHAGMGNLASKPKHGEGLWLLLNDRVTNSSSTDDLTQSTCQCLLFPLLIMFDINL